MSIAQTQVDDAAFVLQVATNIRTVLAMRQLSATKAARRIGMTPQVFSQRMTGVSRWLASDIDRLATELKVTPGVLLAHDEAEFRKQLSTMGYKTDNPFHSVDCTGQGVLIETDGTSWNEAPPEPFRLAV